MALHAAIIMCIVLLLLSDIAHFAFVYTMYVISVSLMPLS